MQKTDAQRNASRRNGAKSRRPVTAAGKRNSSRNAITHGLLADTIVLHGESRDRFLALLTALENQFEPAGPVEQTLVENLAIARWRQLRIWGLEKSIVDLESDRVASSLDVSADEVTIAGRSYRKLNDDSRSIELVNRYAASCDRQYHRALRQLIIMQDRRTQPDPPPPTLTKGTQQPSENKGPHLVPPPPPAATSPAPAPSLYTRKPGPRPSVIYSKVGRILKIQEDPLIAGAAA